MQVNVKYNAILNMKQPVANLSKFGFLKWLLKYTNLD